MSAEEIRHVGLTEAEVASIRADALDDPFFFGRVICGHRELSPWLHRPLMYIKCGLVDKLAAILDDPNVPEESSYTIQQIRRELGRHEVDWRTPEGRERMRTLFRFVNIRVSRFFGKSSSLTHACSLWKITRDPNLTIANITNVDDPKARDFCKQIRATILSPLYGVVFPDRVPADPKVLTETRILLAGRTVPDMEPCLTSFGFKTSPTGYHFDDFNCDDLVARENRSAVELAEARDFLANMFGLFKPGVRYPITRAHEGTRWDDEDDDEYLRKDPQCFTINVPGWLYDDPSVPDLMGPGRSTAPEWKSTEGMIELRRGVLADQDGGGAIAWRCNVLLDPSVAGGRPFPAELVESSEYVTYRAALTAGLIPPAERKIIDLQRSKWIVRQQFDLKTNKPTGKWITIDPDTLFKVTCCDQSFSPDEGADEWAVGTVGMDGYGHRYEIEVSAGHGVEYMMGEFARHVTQHKSRRYGQEKIAASTLLELVVKGDRKYRCLMNVEPIPHFQTLKALRIRQFVAEIMRMNRLWINPADVATKQEMKKYKGRPNDTDNRLDVMAMCEVLLHRPQSTKRSDPDDFRRKLESRNEASRQRVA